MRARRAERESESVNIRQRRLPRKRAKTALFLRVITKHVRMTGG